MRGMEGQPPTSPDEHQMGIRLAEAVLALCHDMAKEYRLSGSCVLGALGIGLGIIAGRSARESDADFDKAVRVVLQHVWRVATAEYYRVGGRLH